MFQTLGVWAESEKRASPKGSVEIIAKKGDADFLEVLQVSSFQ